MAARDAARRAADSGDSDAAASAEELATVRAELATVRAQKNEIDQKAQDEAKALREQIQQLEDALSAAESVAQDSSAAPAPAPATAPADGGGAQAAIVLQTVRSSIAQHKNRIESDENDWKGKEVAIGKAIQDLLQMVQKNPSSRDMVYGLLNDLQGVLDSGSKMVKRNRQFIEEEEAALTSLESNLS